MEKGNLHRMEELLERYFEGETSAAEEKQIRAFFASGQVPEHWAVYIPLFAYFDEEIERNATEQNEKPDWEIEQVSVSVRYKSRMRTAFYILSGVAACVLAFLSLTRLLYPADSCFCSDNYVVINGRCYTDIHTVRSLAIEALQEVATPADTYFSEIDKEEENRQLVDDQLRELGSLFRENE